MKNNIIFVLMVSLIFISCDDMLDKYPLDKLSPHTYFSNENEMRLYTDAFYTMFPSADDVYGESADAIIISTLTDEVSGQRIIPDEKNGWEFDKLRDINFFLENSGNCKNEEIRNKYNGVARFFRAYFYFEKVKRYGDVPWYGRVLGSDDEDLYKPRDSRTLVMDSVLADIDYAIRKLPKEKELYRVSCWTALALKSRICLFEGTFRKYHGIAGYEKFLDECIDASRIFINESGYDIYDEGKTPYQDLFASLNANGREIILARDYSNMLSLVHNVQNYTNSSSVGKPGMAKKIVNSYLTLNGKRFTDIPGYETMQFYEECQDRDPRLAQTIRVPGYVRKGGKAVVAPNLAYTMTGYHIIKYTMETTYDSYKKSCCDIPLFRTAEVYLNYAEAAAERGVLTQTDLDMSIRPLRKRVGMPDLDMTAANNTPDPYLLAPETGYPNVSVENRGVILEIRRERTIELFMEGFRYYDIMRWKEGKAFEQDFLGMYFPSPGEYDLDKNGTIDVCFYEGTKPPSFALLLEIRKQIDFSEGNKGNIICHNLNRRTWREDRDYLYPIPLRERSLTGGKITQNPGWSDGLDF